MKNKVRETVSRDCDLEDSDIAIIRQLIFDVPPNVRNMVLKGLASHFKQLPLCKYLSWCK